MEIENNNFDNYSVGKFTSTFSLLEAIKAIETTGEEKGKKDFYLKFFFKIGRIKNLPFCFSHVGYEKEKQEVTFFSGDYLIVLNFWGEERKEGNFTATKVA